MENDIDEFIKIGLETFRELDYPRYYPFSFVRLLPYYSDLRSKKLLEAISNLKKKEIPLKKIADSFPTVPTLRIEIGLSLIDLKIAGYQKNTRIEIFDFFNSLIKIRAKKDYYGKNSCIEKTDEELKNILKKVKFSKVSKKDAKNLGLLSASLASLTMALYYDNFPHQSYEIEGPYELDGNRKLLIKKNIRLKPYEIFEHTLKYKYENVELYVIYNDINIKLDAINHVSYDNNAVNATEKVALFIDGKQIFKLSSKIDSLIEYFGELSQKQFEYFDSLSFKEKKRMFLFQREYALKDFFTLAEIEWKPSEEMLKRVKDRKLLPVPKEKKENKNKIFVKLFDPRCEAPFKEKMTLKLLRALYYR